MRVASRSVSILVVLALLVSLPQVASAQPRHFWQSGKFWATFAISTAATLADYKTSEDCFRRGCVEQDPFFGSARPSMARMTAMGMPITFAISWAGYKMSESKHPVLRDTWLLPTVAQTASHGVLAYENAKYCTTPKVSFSRSLPGCRSTTIQEPPLK
jgi:hypothetical protein